MRYLIFSATKVLRKSYKNHTLINLGYRDNVHRVFPEESCKIGKIPVKKREKYADVSKKIH